MYHLLTGAQRTKQAGARALSSERDRCREDHRRDNCATCGSGVHGMCTCMCLPGDKLTVQTQLTPVKSSRGSMAVLRSRRLHWSLIWAEVAHRSHLQRYSGQEPQGMDRCAGHRNQVALNPSAGLVCSDFSEVGCGCGLVRTSKVKRKR